jgi:hypothetical protein
LDSLPPFPRRPSSIWSLSAQLVILKKSSLLAHHRKVKKISLNLLLNFSDSSPIQIHNHAYSLAGIYSQKTGSTQKWHKLYFTQQQRNDNNDLQMLYFHKIIVICILEIPQVVEFPDFSPSRMSVNFIPYRKVKIRTVRKNPDSWQP